MSENEQPKDEQWPAEGQDRAAAKKVVGTVIRGADGKLYFIPDDELVSYQITDPEDQQTLEGFYKGLTRNLQTTVDARRVAAPISNFVHNRFSVEE